MTESADLWNAAVSSNNATAYFLYLENSPGGSHAAEAKQKTDAFYEAAVKKVKEGQANASDPKGVEMILNLLGNAQAGRLNEIDLRINSISTGLDERVFEESLSKQFKKMFPEQSLYISTYWRYRRLPGSKMRINVTKAVEKTKPSDKKNERNSNASNTSNSEKKYDFNCVVETLNKPNYEFDLKSAAVEDFNDEMARRFGFTAISQ